MPSSLLLMSTLLVLGTDEVPATSGVGDDRPNVVFFLVDDLGAVDVGCFGSTFHKTPNIDRLAASGMKFTQAYAACPVCSPTRASILTGRHPVRVNITDWIPGRRKTAEEGAKFAHIEDAYHLALEEVTLAEQLRDVGYKTFFAGKWHLGGGPGDEARGYNGGQTFLPTDQGFDINVGGGEFGSPYGGYYAPWTNPRLVVGHPGDYLTTTLTDRAVEFLRIHKHSSAKPAPFLLYFSYYNVHLPLQPYKPRLAEFQQAAAEAFEGETPVIDETPSVSRGRQDSPEYATMVAAVDESVGRVLKTLDDLGLSENTIVVFFSDNGGLCTRKKPGPTCNLPFRSGKGWLYEGGVREPLIIQAPGHTAPGSVCDAPVVSTDLAPTLTELCRIEATPDLHADGRSLMPELHGVASEPRTLYWHYPHYHGTQWSPGASIRDGDWKLIEFYETDKVELYNLADDVGEQHDLSTEHPEKTAELREKLRSWQKAMNATMPVPIASTE